MLDNTFVSKLVKLGFPIALQNLFFVLGNSVTTFMTGRLGELPIAAAGLSNQLFFILMLVQFGISSGGSIFTAQYWGKGKKEAVLRTLGVTLLLGFIAGGIFLVIAVILPGVFLGILTNDKEAAEMATGLLRIAGFSFIFTPITNTYGHILRTTGVVKLPMFASVTGILLNTLLGYGLIFGKLGMPEMGVYGAGVANLAARVVECILLILSVYRLKTPLAAPLRKIFSFNLSFFRTVARRVLPVTLNELLWVLGITAYGAIFARMGTSAYAAVTIKDTTENIIFVPFQGMTNALGILVGNTIDAGKPEKAQDYVRQTFLINLALGGIFGGILFALREPIIGIFNISPETHALALNIITILSAAIWLRSSNLIFFIGMMRSGGDTRFAYLMDAGAMWLIGVPLALAGAFLFRLPAHLVYLLVMIEETIKFFISAWRFRSRRWIHDLTSA